MPILQRPQYQPPHVGVRLRPRGRQRSKFKRHRRWNDARVRRLLRLPLSDVIEALEQTPRPLLQKLLRRNSKSGCSLESFWPVADTEIGRLDIMMANEGFYPENARALAMNGAEIVYRASYPHPATSNELFEIQSRAHALSITTCT
jgi:Carbon-nitrogen hydrolase